MVTSFRSSKVLPLTVLIRLIRSRVSQENSMLVRFLQIGGKNFHDIAFYPETPSGPGPGRFVRTAGNKLPGKRLNVDTPVP